MTDLKALLERVKAATGPDREIDYEIAFATQFRPPAGSEHRISFDQHEARHGYATAWIAHSPWHGLWGIPAYTASIDAALALVERVLPGCWYVLAKGRMTEAEPLFGCELLFGADEQLGIADGPTQPLAILSALLSALIAKDAQQ